jgi:hypothetical protein
MFASRLFIAGDIDQRLYGSQFTSPSCSRKLRCSGVEVPSAVFARLSAMSTHPFSVKGGIRQHSCPDAQHIVPGGPADDCGVETRHREHVFACGVHRVVEVVEGLLQGSLSWADESKLGCVKAAFRRKSSSRMNLHENNPHA